MNSPLVSPHPIQSFADLRFHDLRRWAVLAVLTGGLLVAGSAAPVLKTPTGKPDVTIRGASKGAIFDLLADQMLSNDFLLKGRSENTAVFAKSRTTFGGSGTEYRVTYNLIDTPAGVRVMASMVQYAHPNTFAEKVDIDYSRHPKTAPGIQAILEHAKKTLEGRPAAPAPAGPPTDRAQALAALEQTVAPNARCEIQVIGLEIEGNKVALVLPGGPAEKAGLQPGDVLVSIDGEPATTSVQNGARLNGKADTSVLVLVQRGDRQLKVPVIREKTGK